MKSAEELIGRESDVISFDELASLHPKQVMARKAMYKRPEAMVLAGGSGFGGKSYLLRAAAVGHHLYLRKLGIRAPKTVILSSTYETLRDRHFDYIEKEWASMGRLFLNDKTYGRCFRFYDKAMGAICFRNAGDQSERKGTEFAAGFVDELTELTQKIFGDITYMVRAPGMPCLPILAATNPDGIGHSWVKGLWRPTIPNENRHLPISKAFDPTQTMDPDDYIFVPFLPDDNPVFEEKAFWRSVANLPEHVQRARRYGSWDAPEGARFRDLREDIHLFDPEIAFPSGIPENWVKLVGADYGLRAPYAALWMTVDYDGDVWIYREDYQAGLTADAQAQRIKSKTLANEFINSFYLDPSMFAKLPGHQGPTDKSVADYYNEEFKGDPRFPALQKGYNKSRIHALSTIDRFLSRGNNSPNLHISTSCHNLWRELSGAVFKQGGFLRELSEDIDERSPDHAITALYYVLHTRFSGPALPDRDDFEFEFARQVEEADQALFEQETERFRYE